MNTAHSPSVLRCIVLAGTLALAGMAVAPAADGVGRVAPPMETRLSPDGGLTIVRQPGVLTALRERPALAALPSYDAAAGRGWQVDLRGRDVTALELATRLADLRHADFDSQTRWPAKLPDAFQPKNILLANVNPGLGVRALHARGVTGAGVGIGIVDQVLLVNHVEYRDRLRSYEEIHTFPGVAQMHGPAVASIAVGKSVGVAPGADLYYIAETHGEYSAERKFEWDFTWVAKSIDRLLEINATLPGARKLRVISISVGWGPDQKGYAETMAAVERATKAGVFVISTALEGTHRLSFHGLGRDLFADPDRPESYEPGTWWAQRFWEARYNRMKPGQRLLVPMDSRAVASPTGAEDYVFYAQGGWSWSVPWIAGLYALACQVRPEITPEVFWTEALRTGTTVQLKHGDEEIAFGTIANPAALIAELERRRGA